MASPFLSEPTPTCTKAPLPAQAHLGLLRAKPAAASKGEPQGRITGITYGLARNANLRAPCPASGSLEDP